MIIVFLYLTSGLFLGWSLGANDASNVFGTAVGSRMIRFRTAAVICSVFVILGAVLAGSGASHTLGKLGSVSSLPGAFTIALSAAVSVFLMTRAKLPVSTSQAIVGGLIGWNFYKGLPTDLAVVRKIVLTWILCPVLAALIAALVFILIRFILKRVRVHILHLDRTTRIMLLAAGAFGSYSLGANNIANVMGVFVHAVPLSSISFGSWTFTVAQQLFFLGGLAIAVGIFTYSKRVMMTVGNDLFQLSPMAAFIAVFSHSVVLFVFSSAALRDALISLGLPPVPLVPVSSSQAIVGAVLGIGLVKTRGRNIKFGVLRKIALGWLSTPVIAGVFTFVILHLFDRLISRV